MTIERVGKEHLKEIVALNSLIFESMYPWPPFTIRDYEKRLRDTPPLILIAKDKDMLVGNAIGFEQDGAWYIWVLGVLPEYRKQGIATQFFLENEQCAKQLGFTLVRTKVYNVSREMLRLATKRGYAVVKTTEHENPLYKANILELRL